MSIPRAIVYHPVRFDVNNWFRSFRLGAVPGGDPDSFVAHFEKSFASYVGAKRAVAFPFARSALYFSLKSQGWEPGSEIIMPPITIKPMMDVVVNLGLTPVFADLERETLCFHPEAVERAISPRTKGILITYLFGITPDLDRLISFCRRQGLFIIEDFSHALNAEHRGKKLGTLGDVGIYSCSITKTLDTYGGGLAVTDNRELGATLAEAQASLHPTPPRRLRAKILKTLVWNLATRKPVFTLFVFPLLQIMKRISPEMADRITGARLGLSPDSTLPKSYFERFTWIQASVGLDMLGEVAEGDGRRITNVYGLERSLVRHGSPHPRSIEGVRNVYWQFVVFPRDTLRLQRALNRGGIDTGTTNLSLISGLGIYPEYEKECPNAEFIKQNAMYVPANPRMNKQDLNRVKSALEAAFLDEERNPQE